MADEDRIVEPEETSEAVNMASEATPPPEASEATPPPETEEARDDLSTPTQDETAQLISSLAPGVSASGIEAATSALRGIPMPTSTNNSTDKTPPPQASGIDEISDSEFAEDDLANEALRPVDKSLEIPAENSADQRSRSRLSNVSSSDADLGATGKKDKNGDDSDAVSLSGLSSAADGERLQIRSDVEDGEIPTKNNAENHEIVEIGKVNGHIVISESDSDVMSVQNDKRSTNNNRKRQQFRKRSPRESERNRSPLKSPNYDSDSDRGNKSDVSWSRRRSSSPRQSLPKRQQQQNRGQQRELQRYDVRNVINRKRAAKNGTGIGGRKSRSRSPRSRSPRSRSPRSRSSPRSASSPRRRNAIRHSRSPVPFGSGRLARRRKSKSRSPPARNKRNRRLGRQGSFSPGAGSRSPPPARNNKRGRRGGSFSPGPGQPPGLPQPETKDFGEALFHQQPPGHHHQQETKGVPEDLFHRPRAPGLHQDRGHGHD